MGHIKIRKGLDLPISGTPVQEISEGNPVDQVALLGADYIGMKPKFAVSVGDRVKLGQVLFTDKNQPHIRYTAPGSGRVSAINRGERRKFVSLVIDLEGDGTISFQRYSEKQIAALNRERILSQLLRSGLWTAIRSRPFNMVADPDDQPHAVFVTAIDTNPLAPSIEKILGGHEKYFSMGLEIISRLTTGKLFLCKGKGSKIPSPSIPNLSVEEFSGPHPAGNVGTHIHFLDPVNRNKKVWHLNAQDVVEMGFLFMTGKRNPERIISLAGPCVKNPRLIKTRLGGSVSDITAGECTPTLRRIISGSVLSGHTAEGLSGFLGRYHQQITVIPERSGLGFFGWMNPGFNLFSAKNILLSRLFPRRTFDFDTTLHGGQRAIVDIGSYDKVMPMDILPAYLLRALAVDDIEEAEKLGCLELDEEDLALCTYVCPSKIDHGSNLRRNLTIIEREG